MHQCRYEAISFICCGLHFEMIEMGIVWMIKHRRDHLCRDCLITPLFVHENELDFHRPISYGM